MKIVYIILAVVVVLGFVFVFLGKDDKKMTDTGELPINTSQTDPDDAVPEAEPGDTAAPVAGVEMEGGTDVGMEFPDPELSDVVETVVEDDTLGEANEFTVDAFSFGYSMEEIRVKEGDVVTINLTNSGGFHDWVLEGYEVETDKINAGESTSITFTASKKGSFEYYCSVGNHRAQGMVGTLIVE